MADNELEAIFSLDDESPIGAKFDIGEQQGFDCEFRIDATTFDYSALDNKPQINGEVLEGDKSSSDLHLASEQGLIDEIENRQNADIEFANNLSELDSKVDGINANLTQQIEETQQDLNNKYNELLDDISDLSDTVDDNYDELDEKIDSTANTINQRITDVADELQQSIEENVVALQQEDTALQNQINAHSQTLTAYDTRITNNSNAIGQEVIDRQNADDNLQEQIDGITAGSDVKDIVGTYAELQAYDKSTLGDNDIIKVLQDETKENASTYYRYIASTQSFTYIGKEGPFYTKSETDTLLNAKQDTITDLVTIRNNASDGKVASDTIATYGDIVTHNADEFATTEALSQGLATKQNTLVSGTNIKTINNTSVLGSGNIEIRGASSFAELEGQPEDNENLKISLDLKQNITDNNLVTTAKTIVGAVNELDAKIKDIQLYKFPNAIIIGQPTINNGQISGFSQQNYLTLPFLFDVGDRAFELNYAFRTGNDVTTPQNLFGSNYCIASYIQNSKLNVRVSSNGTSWDVVSLETSLNVLANTVYYIKIAFNKLNYTISASTDGTTYNQIGYIVNTKKPIAGNVFIGIGNNQNNPFLGVINLNRWDIKLNNSIIWEGMDDVGLATRADISLSNLDEQGQSKFDAKQDVIDDLEQIRTNANLVTTKQDIISDLSAIRSNASTGAGLAPQVAVNTQRIEDLTTAKFPNVVIIGTPHIEGGQVSNYSDTSYLQFPFVDISRGQPFDIYFSFTTGANITTQQNILDSYFGIALAIQNGKGIMALSSNGSSWDIGMATGTNTILPNTTYYVKYSWTGTQYNASLSLNDETYLPDMILNSNLSPHKTTIFIGGSPNLFGPSTAHPFKGTINFNKSKVVVNNITVWEGMADVGLASRANVSLNNLDEVGEKRFSDLQTAIDGKQPAGDYATNTALTTHTSNDTIHVTERDKMTWNFLKQDVSDSHLTTEYKTIVGAINELNAKIQGGGGLEVCDIGQALYIDESKGLRRYLNGSTVAINTNTQAFLDRLKEIVALYPSLATTEENWQAERTMSVFGQCGKFVIDEVAGTIRLPRIVMPIQGLTDLSKLGELVEVGLPNITGQFESIDNPAGYVLGAFYSDNEKDGPSQYGASGTKIRTVNFDASRSNAIYGNSNTVQQEQIQYPYFIQIATGQETQVDIVNTIELNNPYSFGDCKYTEVELNNISWLHSQGQWNSKAVYVDYYNWVLANANGNVDKFKKSTDTYTDYDWVVDTANETYRLPIFNSSFVIAKGEENGINYQIYQDGYCEQWGYTDQAHSGITVALLKHFKDANYNITVGTANTSTSVYETEISSVTVSSFKVTSNKGGGTATGNVYWKACGYLTDGEYTPQNLYYYVGETVQNANLINAGRIQEQLTDKLDKNHSNDTKPYLKTAYINGTSGYNIWSNGYCEQWGVDSTGNGVKTVTLLKRYKNLEYSVIGTTSAANVQTDNGFSYNIVSENTITIAKKNTNCSWRTYGYLAEGEY